MSTAARMESKGLLSRRRDGRAFIYQARSADADDLAIDQIVAALEEEASVTTDDVAKDAVVRWAERDTARISGLLGRLDPHGRTQDGS